MGKHTSLSYVVSGTDPIVIVTNDRVGKLAFIIRPNSDDVSCLLLDERYELLSWFYPNIYDAVFVDVGAHVGGYTVRACRGGARLVVAIEPYTDSLKVLKRNLELNNCRRHVIIINKAVGDARRLAKLKVPKGMEAMAHITSDGDMVVEMDTLDNIINELGLNRIDLIKIDIEGAEILAIKGMRRTLDITRRIMIEVRPWTKWILKNLEEAGFKVIECVDHVNFMNVYLIKKKSKPGSCRSALIVND